MENKVQGEKDLQIHKRKIETKNFENQGIDSNQFSLQKYYIEILFKIQCRKCTIWPHF